MSLEQCTLLWSVRTIIVTCSKKSQEETQKAKAPPGKWIGDGDSRRQNIAMMGCNVSERQHQIIFTSPFCVFEAPYSTKVSQWNPSAFATVLFLSNTSEIQGLLKVFPAAHVHAQWWKTVQEQATATLLKRFQHNVHIWWHISPKHLQPIWDTVIFMLNICG